jgi:hypothetical protein
MISFYSFSQTFNSAYFDNNINRSDFNMKNICLTPINNGVITVGSTNYTQTGYNDCFFQKINNNNLVAYTKYITSTSLEKRNEVINDVIELSSGEYLVCGEANLNNKEPFGTTSNYQSFLMKISANGTTVSSKLYTNTSVPTVNSPTMQSGFYKLLSISSTEAIVAGYYSYSYNSNDYKALWIMNINPTTLNINWSKLYLPPYDINNVCSSKNLNIFREGSSNNFYISSSNNIYNIYTSSGDIRNFTSLSANNNKVIDISGITIHNNMLAFSGSISEDSYTNRNTAFVTYTDRNLLFSNIPNISTKRFGISGATFGNGNRIVSKNGILYMIAYKYYANTLFNYQPFLVQLENNTLSSNSFNISSYKYDIPSLSCILLNNSNNNSIGFNTNSYGTSSPIINNYFIANTPVNSLNCNSSFNSVTEYPISINFSDPNVVISTNVTGFTTNSTYFPTSTTTILTANKQDYTCCNSPELLQWGDFEATTYSPCLSSPIAQFLNIWRGSIANVNGICSGTGTWLPTSIGTEWFYTSASYGYRNSRIVNNTKFSAAYTFNISNKIFNNNVFLFDLEPFLYGGPNIYFNPINMTIWKQEFETSTLGDYLFCIDFGSVNINACGNNINVEILLTDLAANLTTSVGFYKSNNNCITSSTNNNLGYNDFCFRLPLQKRAYSIALVVRNASTNYLDYSIDNISLKRICGDCPPNSNRTASKEEPSILKNDFNNSGLNVFPNPSNSSVNFTFNVNDISNGTLQVYDYQGKIVNELFNNKQFFNGEYKYNLDVSTLPSGLYLVILDMEGKKSIQKFVVQH